MYIFLILLTFIFMEKYRLYCEATRNVRCERKFGLDGSFLLRPRCAIEVALQPATVIESPSGLANHRASIAIRRYPERFVRAIASGAHERSHLLPLQHTRKKACDNYYGEYVSSLSLSSLSFHPVATSILGPSLSYTLHFPRLPSFPSQLFPPRVIIFFVLLVSQHFAWTKNEQMLRKIRHKRDKISMKRSEK